MFCVAWRCIYHHIATHSHIASLSNDSSMMAVWPMNDNRVDNNMMSGVYLDSERICIVLEDVQDVDPVLH